MPLRRQPKVSGPIRIVEVAGYDWSPCGGTHLANSAEVGLIKITGSERRGAEMRLTFLCGRRARADYARLQDLAAGLSQRFTTGRDEVLDAVDRVIAEARATRKDLAELTEEWVCAQAAAWIADAHRHASWRVICKAVDLPVERARRLAHVLVEEPGIVVLLGVRGDRPQLFCARSADVSLDAGALLRQAAAAGGGRGGGRPEWAQGGTPDDKALERALAAGLAALTQD